MPAHFYGIATFGWYRALPSNRDPQFLRFIRKLPCIVCWSSRYIEAAHFGPRGLGQKADDRRSLPLCTKHHRTGSDSYHRLGPVKFAQRHDLDVNTLISLLNTFFDEKLRGAL